MNLASLFGSLLRGGNNFGALGIATPRSVFGGLANNPSINSLTNANAMTNYSNSVGGVGGFGGLFPTFGGGTDLMGNMMAQTLARKAARKRARQNALTNPIDTNPMYGGGSTETPVAPVQGDPDMFGDFDPISQMGSMAAGAGSAFANRGETYEEFKKRTGKTGMKEYMRDNPYGSK
tara:strand:- start:44 stop:574 length:531 start_codon:yes stop_codon:yes gene_type:complete